MTEDAPSSASTTTVVFACYSEASATKRNQTIILHRYSNYCSCNVPSSTVLLIDRLLYRSFSCRWFWLYHQEWVTPATGETGMVTLFMDKNNTTNKWNDLSTLLTNVGWNLRTGDK